MEVYVRHGSIGSERVQNKVVPHMKIYNDRLKMELPVWSGHLGRFNAWAKECERSSGLSWMWMYGACLLSLFPYINIICHLNFNIQLSLIFVLLLLLFGLRVTRHVSDLLFSTHWTLALWFIFGESVKKKTTRQRINNNNKMLIVAYIFEIWTRS